MIDKTLNKQMTELVLKYINRGYVINGRTMRGSNGTEHIDLTKGKDFIRIVKECESCREDGFYGRKMILSVKGTRLENGNTDIVWDSAMDTIEEKSYYVIGDYYCGNYCLTDSKEEAVLCKEKSRIRSRIGAIDEKEYRDIDHLKVGFKAIKKQPRTKCVHLEDVEKVVRGTTRSGKAYFTIYYNTKSARKTIAVMA